MTATNSLQHIVVAIDFSDGSDAALRQAARLSTWNRAQLHILHVIESLVVRDLAEALGESIEVVAARTIDHAREEITRRLTGIELPRPAVTHVIVGEPLDEVLRLTASLPADLLVLGVFGHGGPGHGAGTLASKCVRKAAAPVLLIHPSHTRAFQRILACIDFSPTSHTATTHALRIAVQDGARLHLLHVFNGPWNTLHYRSPSPESTPDFQAQYTRALQQRLDATLAEHRDAVQWLGTVSADLVEHAGYGHGIIRFASDIDADLIVMGAKGHSSLRYLVLGSTAERVLREVACSLLVVKPPA